MNIGKLAKFAWICELGGKLEVESAHFGEADKPNHRNCRSASGAKADL